MNKPVVFQKAPIVLEVQPGSFWWCTCGVSKKQPFCDGSHKGSTFSPLKTDLTQPGKVAWCACKHSQKAPFCDGSHSRLG